MTLIRRVGETDASLEGAIGGWLGGGLLEWAVRTGAEKVERTNVGRSPKGLALKENGEMRQ